MILSTHYAPNSQVIISLIFIMPYRLESPSKGLRTDP